MKSIFLWSGVGLLVAAGVWGVVTLSPATQNNGEVSTGLFSVPIDATDHVKGNTESPVTLVEYGDFQCPACGAYFPVLKQLEIEFGQQIQMVYRHFPLPIHRNAEVAAQAAEAAGLQGKFWEMHDILYIEQADWSGEDDPKEKFVTYAESLGLAIEQFENDIDSDAVKDRVDRDNQAALKDQLNGTPSFFLNNQQIVAPQSYEAFRQLLEQALKQELQTP